MRKDFVDKRRQEFAVGGFFSFDFAQAVCVWGDDAVVGLCCYALDEAEGDGVHVIEDTWYRAICILVLDQLIELGEFSFEEFRVVFGYGAL